MEFCGIDLPCWQHFFNVGFWQGFLSELIATFIGAGIGVWGALWLSRYQEKQTEMERKVKILLLIRKELEHNKDTISNKASMLSVFMDVLDLATLLKDESWTAFSEGGELEWIKDPDLLGIISEAYHAIKSLRYICDRHIQFSLMGPHYAEQMFAGQNVPYQSVQRTLNNAFKSTQETLERVFLAIDENLGE